MYEFVDTVPRTGSDTESTSMSIQTVFNGFNLDDLLTDEEGSFVTLTVSGRGNLRKRIETTEVPGMDGVLEEDNPTTEHREIVVKYKIYDRTNEGFRERINMLNSLLKGSKKELYFTDEDAFFYATLQANELPEEETNHLIGELVFFCSDPKKYGPEREIEFSSDIHNLTNNGTADTPPIFELEVKEPVTYAMIQNQDDEYMMIGKPYDITEQQPFLKEEKIYDKIGDSTTGWATASTVDGGVVDGVFYVSGQAWRAQTYGDVVPAWHGPSLQQSLPELLDDFKVEVFMSVKPKTLKSFGRAELYLLNQGGAKIGKLAMKNIGSEGGSNIGEAIIRNESTGNQQTLIHTPGAQQRLWNNFYGVLRLERENGVFKAYIAMIDTETGRHHTRWHSDPFMDNQGLYDDLLAGVQIHIGQYGATQFIEDIAIHRIVVYKINQQGDNQIPYIAYPGDIITFNHVEKDILMNGESRKDLKNFGASYFNLKAGENQLVVMPENAFDVKCKYREGFK